MQWNKTLKKRLIRTAAASVMGIFLVCSGPLSAVADNGILSAAGVPIYEINMNDSDPMSLLKKEAITKYVESKPFLSMSKIDLDASSIQTTGINWTKSGIQTVRISLSIVKKDDTETGNTVGYDYVEDAAIKLVKPEGPTLILKQEEMTVDLNSSFSYSDNLGIIFTSDNSLPIITEKDNVDTSKEGTYTVKITAVDAKGSKSHVSYKVNVVTPEEDQAVTHIEDGVTVIDSSEVEVPDSIDHDTGDSGNAYPYGQCTWWCYVRRHELNLPCGSYFGDAKDWVDSAEELGYEVSNTPHPGDIVVFMPGQASADPVYGHVAIVESVVNGEIVISESNAGGRAGVITTRTLDNVTDYMYIHY